MKIILFCVIMSVSVCSCVLEKTEQPLLHSDTYRITVEVEIPESKYLSKSSLMPQNVDKITDMNIFVYHDGTLLEECCRYCTDLSSVMMAFPHDMDGFNIYMIGNVGRISPPVLESDIVSLRYVIDSYDDFKTKGFPVAEKFCGYRKGTLAHFKVKRLVGQYDIRMRTSADNVKYMVRDVKLLNCAKDVYPFDPVAKASVFTRSDEGGPVGDSLTQADVYALNGGRSVTLYFVENLQGVLLPDNYDRKKKIPSVLESIATGLSDCCTYMEITADVWTSSAKYHNAKYRFYLGQDETSDFSVRRNTRCHVILDFTQNMVNEEEWRIEAGEPEVNSVYVSKNVAKVIKGVEDVVYVQAYSHNGSLLDFEILRYGENNGKFLVHRTDTTYNGKPVAALKITSDNLLDGFYKLDETPHYYTACLKLRSKETYNGTPLWEKDIEVRVYHKLFPLLVRLEKGSSGTYSVVLRGHNPMNLSLSVSADYKCSDGFTGTVSGSGRYADVNATGTSVTGFGQFDYRVTDSSLEQVDFTVRSNNDVSGYPRLVSASVVFVGNAPIIYGPGSDVYPAKWQWFSDDSKIYLEKGSGGVEDWGTGNWIEGYDAKFETDGLTYYTVYKYYNEEIFAVKDLGANSWHGNYSDDCEKAPFYFVNGCMEYAESQWSSFSPAVKWPNKIRCGGDINLLAPGRDLFFEYKGVEDVRTHKVSWWFAYWKNLLGNYKTRHEIKSYQGKPYMTINNSVRWLGGDVTEDGYFTDAY